MDLAIGLRSSILMLSRRLRLQTVGDTEPTASQLNVLGALGNNGPMAVGELATHEKVKPPTMTRTVSSMERAGLVRRRPHAGDRRQVLVEVTPAAPELIATLRHRRDEWLRFGLAALTPAELDTLRKAASVLECLAE